MSQPKVRVENVYKIFGPHPQRALELLLKENLDKDTLLARYGHTVGLRDVSFEVRPGEVFVVMGLSGSGKSTLVRCLNRLIDPTAGRIEVDGEDVTAMKGDALRTLRRSRIAMVFQRFALLPHRNVLDNVAFGLELQGVPTPERHARAMAVIEVVGLKGWEHHMPDALSGGMQQRVGLARALAIDPDILLMDEPFSALDPLIRRDMQNELIRLQQEMKKTIIFITHDLDEAIKLGDRIAVMKDGEIRQIGTAEEILRRPADDYVAEFVQDVDPARVLTAEQIMFDPDTTVPLTAGPRTAVRVMRRHGLSSVFVIGEGERVAGIVTVDDAVRAADTGEGLAGILRHDFPRVAPHTPLHELIPIAARARFPIAVTDADGRLLGLIVRVTVLSSLMREPSGAGADAPLRGWVNGTGPTTGPGSHGAGSSGNGRGTGAGEAEPALAVTGGGR